MDAPRHSDTDEPQRFIADRNLWLIQDDRTLLEHSRQEFFVATGNGGQKRNHTNTAVRICHLPSGVVVTDCETRSQQRNREIALHKLRLEIAMKIRGPELPQPDCGMNMNNPKYPLLVAWLMDVVVKSELEPRIVAEKTGLSRTGILKLLARDTQLWQYFNRLRNKAGLSALHRP